MMQTETQTQDRTETATITDRIAQWAEATHLTQEHCRVELTSGTELWVRCPLGAAVQLEELGFRITVH